MKKVFFSLLISLICSALVSCSKGNEPVKVLETGIASKGDRGYTYKIISGDMEFNWSIKGKNIHVKLKGKTSGWISAGFNSTDGMKDANFIMGVVKDGKVEVSNQIGVSKILHKNITDLGGKNYILNPAGSLKDDVTEISFDYPLSTGDKMDRPINVNGETILLLGMARTSFMSQQHMFRSKLSVNLSNGSYAVLSKK